MAPSLEAPVAEWVEPGALLEDPYPTYQRLRDLGPVAWVPSLNRYLVTSFGACRDIEEDQQTYSASIRRAPATMARALGGEPMLRKDDPQHAVERRPTNAALRAKALRSTWAPVFEHNAQTWLRVLRERGPDDADLDRDFAAPVAAQNLIDLLGIRGADVEDMRRWSHAFIAGIGNLGDDPEIWRRCDRARAEVDERLAELVPHYREHPDGSITSALVRGGLPDSAVAANVKLTISGGMNEPQHTVTGAVWALSRHPDQRDRVLADDSSWPAVFEETVRWLSPIGMYPRETTRPVVLHDVALPAAAPLGVVVGAANRDETVFERAESFDTSRPRRPHLGFGSGTHFCAGYWASRIAIGEIAVPLLHRSLPGLRTDPRRPEQWRGWVFRGLTTLPVTWDPGRGSATRWPARTSP